MKGLFSLRTLLLCVLIVCIAACAGIERFLQKFEPELVYYKEVGLSPHKWRNSYSSNDSLNIKYFMFCAESGKNGSKKDRTYHSFNESEIAASILAALRSSDIPTKQFAEIERVDGNAFCEMHAHPFKEYVLKLLENRGDFLNSPSTPLLFLACNYGAYWEYDVEAAPPAGLVSTGRKYYRIRRQLAAVIIEQDTIAYANYFQHLDTAYVNEGEVLEYEWPQEIWDSLTVLTMQRYKDRLR